MPHQLLFPALLTVICMGVGVTANGADDGGVHEKSFNSDVSNSIFYLKKRPMIRDSIQSRTDKNREIEELVDDLGRLDSEDYGLGRISYFAHAIFLPVGAIEEGKLKSNIANKTFRSLLKLVENGPDAIPILLDNLDNNAPTNLVFRADRLGPEEVFSFDMWLDEVLAGNPANPLEREILRLENNFLTHQRREEGDHQIEVYRVKVGDVCMVALGHIVGRRYEAIQDFPAFRQTLINSPVHSTVVRNRIRKIWKSIDPRERLLNSLLIDFSTRRKLDNLSMETWDSWSMCNQIQLDAIMRMLYYYPHETEAAIAARIDQLEVSFLGDVSAFDVCSKNEISPDEFVDAVSWSKSPEIQEALNRLSKRAEYAPVVEALKRSGRDMPGK